MSTSLPNEIAVMALPGSILFPNSMLPLYIFEPRYREMLRRALDEDRIFAIGMLSGDGDDEPVFDVGGAGLIRACVQNPDGTSHLVLQGVQRVRFVEWVAVRPYRIARAVPLESVNQEADEAERLAGVLRGMCNDLTDRGYSLPPQFHSCVEQVESPEALGDLLSSTLIPDPILRQSLLQELDVPVRLKGLISSLNKHLQHG